jgi:cobaltochelatase CobT
LRQQWGAEGTALRTRALTLPPGCAGRAPPSRWREKVGGPRQPARAFRQVLTGAVGRSREPELELGYTAEQPSGQECQGADAGAHAAEREVAEARGYADAAALKLRHHNPALHARSAPADEIARAVFDAAEQARVEALGARAMEGVRSNLARAVEMRMRTDPITRARNRAEVPLGTAVGLVVRERLTGEAPPEAARAGLAWSRLDRGESRRRPRRARPRHRRPGRLRRSRDPAAERPRAGRGRRSMPDPDEGDEGEGGDEAEGRRGRRGRPTRDSGGGGGRGRDPRRAERAPRTMPKARAPTRRWARPTTASATRARKASSRPPNRPLSDLPPQFDYRIFTSL